MDHDKEYWMGVVNHLRVLIQTEEWETFSRQVQDMKYRHVGDVLTGTKETFDRNRGMVDGIQAVLDLPGKIITLWEDKDGR